METPEEKVVFIREVPDPINVNANVQVPDPVQVSMGFENQINVNVETSPNSPIHAAMDMRLSAKEPVPVCISICEPICAQSNYRIGVTLLGQVLAGITVQGETRIANCRDMPQEPRQVCVEFNDLQQEEFPEPFDIQGVTFVPLGQQPINVTFVGAPVNMRALNAGFPPGGIGIAFPQAVNNVVISAQSFNPAGLRFEVFATDGTLLSQFQDNFEGIKDIVIAENNIGSLNIFAPQKEAAIFRVCFSA